MKITLPRVGDNWRDHTGFKYFINKITSNIYINNNIKFWIPTYSFFGMILRDRDRRIKK